MVTTGSEDRMPPITQPKNFASRKELSDHVASITPGIVRTDPGPVTGSRQSLKERLDALDPVAYGRSRNFLDGKVSQLSCFIRHGMISLNQVRNLALDRVRKPADAEKFIQELAWRDYWRRVQKAYPDWIWHDVEAYKTGFAAAEYSDHLEDDIRDGKTGVAAIDDIIVRLKTTGYVHNHARMYLASYVVHWRRIRWQAGARFMLEHLVDADLASNNLSWQWIASTFSRKPYIFNLENMRKYAGGHINTDAEANRPLDASYEELTARLFPRFRSPEHG